MESRRLFFVAHLSLRNSFIRQLIATGQAAGGSHQKAVELNVRESYYYQNGRNMQVEDLWGYCPNTVDGSEILREYQLRLVVYPIIYKVLYIPGFRLGFLPWTVVQTSCFQTGWDILWLCCGFLVQILGSKENTKWIRHHQQKRSIA